jgi:hypothetical protein
MKNVEKLSSNVGVVVVWLHFLCVPRKVCALCAAVYWLTEMLARGSALSKPGG